MEFLDEVALDAERTAETEMDLIILDEKIEKIRIVLNQLVSSKTSFYKNDLIIKISRLLDKLLVIYYYNKYE